jgi:hypothetical protein
MGKKCSGTIVGHTILMKEGTNMIQWAINALFLRCECELKTNQRELHVGCCHGPGDLYVYVCFRGCNGGI